MALDPRTPVIVGVGQLLRRTSGSVAGLSSPPEMMAEALRLAGDDSGTGDALLRRADSVRVVETIGWRHKGSASVLAPLVGASPRQLAVSATGGNSPQMLVNEACLAIQRGELDVVLVAGVEAMQTRRLARKNGEELGWPKDDGSFADEVMGLDKPGSHEAEASKAIVMPTQMYPVFECALRAAAGEGVEEHTVRVSELWSRFSAVAASNPYAWMQEPKSAVEIRTPSESNRLVGFPYTKLMNSNAQTDQAAGLIVCSVEAARSAGVPEDRWVFPLAGADATDHWFVSERADLHSSPAIRLCGESVLGAVGRSIDDVAHVDLYSCFPSAVQIGADALGLDAWDESRVPTVTGGLTFAGGPWNNYVSHSIASMVDVLRADPGSMGLTTALGWFATKHSMCLYSTTPPDDGRFRWESPQEAVDALPRREALVEHEGPAEVEAYTVVHGRSGDPETGIAALLTSDGARTWATTTDLALMDEMVTGDLVGRGVEVAAGTLKA